jgi:hypothetical protein
LDLAKSWRQKLYPGVEPHVSVIDKPMCGFPAGSKLFVATPPVVKRYMEEVPMGQSRTTSQMRQELAKRHGADGTCSLTAGIAVRIAAEAALEDPDDGVPENRITPFWRLVDPESGIAKTLSCGVEFVRVRRLAEGIDA